MDNGAFDNNTILPVPNGFEFGNGCNVASDLSLIETYHDRIFLLLSIVFV